MKAKNGTVYKNNYARTAAFYEVTCATSQENNSAQNFILSIYRAIAEQADFLGLKPVPDVYFDPWEQQKGRESDVKAIRTPRTKIDELMEQLYTFCKLAKITEIGLAVSAEVFSPKKLFKSVLAAVGIAVNKTDKLEIACGKELAESLKKLTETALTLNLDGTENEEKSVFYFSRCVTDKNVDWLCDSFDYMLDAGGEVSKLCKTLAEQGFKRKILIDGRHFSLNYIKEYGKKPEPLKKAWADKIHLGIEISYEDLCIYPATLHLRTVRFAELLSRADQLPHLAKKLIKEKVKTCDGCRYCIQTDKSGTRPLAAFEVDGIAKCPYFPSFSLRWNKVDSDIIEQILSVLEAY